VQFAVQVEDLEEADVVAAGAGVAAQQRARLLHAAQRGRVGGHVRRAQHGHAVAEGVQPVRRKGVREGRHEGGQLLGRQHAPRRHVALALEAQQLRRAQPRARRQRRQRRVLLLRGGRARRRGLRRGRAAAAAAARAGGAARRRAGRRRARHACSTAGKERRGALRPAARARALP
jgi:hypothetical protein